MWFLHKKVLLTKDNLAKRNWKGSSHCSFCGNDENIDHLFISCSFAKLIWWVVFCTYNIPPPTNVTNLFGNWLQGWIKIPKIGFVQTCQLFVGLFEIVGMTLFLTGKTIFMFYRLFVRRCTGFSYGLSYYPRTSGTLQWLDARNSYRWHKIFLLAYVATYQSTFIVVLYICLCRLRCLSRSL